MKVALFVPCYVDAFFPEVGIATLELLERLGCEVDYPLDQTCCGQPMANSGCHADARDTEALFAQELRRLRPHRHAIGQLRPPRARPDDGDRADAGGAAGAAQHARAGDLSARRAAGLRLPVGRVPAQGGLAHRLRHAARAARGQDLGDRRARVQQAGAAARRRQGPRVGAARAARRMLRLRRHLLGVRGAGVGQDGLRQGQRPPRRRRAIRGHARHVVRDAPARLRRAHRAAAEVHPHRAGAQWRRGA